MALVTKTISAIPAGTVALHLYEGVSAYGIFAFKESIAVSEGQTSIEFNAIEGMFYKFQLEDGAGELSAWSSAWQYTVDNRTCLVTGRCIGALGSPVEGVVVTATLLGQTMITNSNVQVAGSASATTNENGEWGLSLLKTGLLSDPFAKYLITFSGSGFSESRTVTIPDASVSDYEDLPLAGSLSSDFDISFELDPDSALWYVGENKYLTFIVKEGESRLSTLLGCTAEVRLRTLDTSGETATYADITDEEGDGWEAAEVDGNRIRLRIDSTDFEPSISTLKYLADCALIAPDLGGEGFVPERLVSPIFKIKFK